MTTQITITGNLGSIDLKFTSGGKAVLTGSVAHNRSRLNRQTNEWEEIGTDWYRFQVWEKKAELLAEHLEKGQRVIVVGTLESREYEKDGAKVTAWEIKAQDVGIIPKGDRTATPTRAALAGNDDPWASQVAPF
jgi:single-strand DNA-binding protein